ncbi:MAG: hypothetical protein IKE63_03680 [Bacilli bacterium]|nr:hypothetical protein [Bacilli bacterium]
MDDEMIAKKQKTFKREMLFVGILAMIVPILLFSITFSGADEIPCRSSLCFNSGTSATFVGMIFGCLSIPFTWITVLGQTKSDTLMIFSGSLFLAGFCLFVITKLTSVPWIIAMIFVAVLLVVLNIDILAIETEINEKKKEE